MNPITIPRVKRPLSNVKEGEQVTVSSIRGGRGVNRRLSELGIGAGSAIKMIQNSGGPVIIMVGDSRMGLGHGVASKIEVE